MPALKRDRFRFSLMSCLDSTVLHPVFVSSPFVLSLCPVTPSVILFNSVVQHCPSVLFSERPNGIVTMRADVAFARYPSEGDEVTVRVHNSRDSVEDDCLSSAEANAPIYTEVDSNYDYGQVDGLVRATQPNDIGDLLQQHHESHLAPHETSLGGASHRQCNCCPPWRYFFFAVAVVLSLGTPAIIFYCTSRGRGTISNVDSSTKQGSTYTDEGNTYLQELRAHILGIDTFRLEPDDAELVASRKSQLATRNSKPLG